MKKIPNKSKRSSSRRKGDEYQDNNALRLALKLYIQRQDYQLFMDYEKAGSLDDILIDHNDTLDAYQVKYAINPNEVYTLENFTNASSKIYFKKFSDSWILLKKQYPHKKMTLHLLTNRGLDAELSNLITAKGYFSPQFIQDRQYKRPREIREKLQSVTQLEDDNFQEFLSCFHFQIKQSSLQDLIQYIQVNLLDHHLGISNRSIYHDLKEIIEDFAINRHDALTSQYLDDVLKQIQSKYLLPQKFVVDKDIYIQREQLNTKLDQDLENVNGDYIIVTGLPGSGKSTSLTVYFDDKEHSSSDVIVRYYCFVDINDNFQKRRLEAQSLRVNLLSLLQDKFHNILPRQFDYSENNFYQVLKNLGEHFTNNNQKLILFIDGLDHAEKMESKIQESIIDALPVNLPKGIVIVVGTQELHKWPSFLKKSRENPNSHIELSLFTPAQTRKYLIDKKQLLRLLKEQIQEIHKKSEGLPLYLRYIADRISETDDIVAELEHIPRIPEGDIKNYYEMLWGELEYSGKGKVRHLCGVLACLRFPVHKNQLFYFQKLIDQPDFDDYFQLIKHFLKKHHNRVEIFHNSFREFILSKLDSHWIQTIHIDITNHLKIQESSNLWFSYIFEYAYKAKDYDYVLDKVNREFVDDAMSRYRSNQDIENAIYWAVECAKEKLEILALSRLATLKSKTHERIEYNLDRTLLSKTLLAMGKEQDVIRYSYSLHHNQWLIDISSAINLLKELPNQKKREIGKKLFLVLEESFRGKELNKIDLPNFAYCLGIYSNTLAHPLKWLSKIKLQPDTLETEQPYIPDYAPHLEAFLEAVVRYRSDDCLERIKKIKKLFSNRLIRYLLIRSIAQYKNKIRLKKEIEEYISLFNPASNPELGFYAALAGLSSDKVSNLLGRVSLPPLSVPEHLLSTDPSLHNYRMIFCGLGYEGKEESIKQLKHHLKAKESWWTSYLLYLLQVGECVGKHWARKQKNWFNLAIDSIDILCQTKQGEKERIIELIELCRGELTESLFWLTKAVVECYPQRLGEWFEKLKSLQESNMWTTHYGIMEPIENYTFELKIYERLSMIPECRKYIIQILQICEDKFKKSTFLKGSGRSDHFLRLALIAAQCSFKDKAEEWLQYGIKLTLIYGYHKDITLFQLIDIMEMLNKHKPETALMRCSDVLEMVDWMPYLTDGKGTKYLPQEIFKQVAKVDKIAALKLLRIYAKNKGRWQMQDCLEAFIIQIQDVDLEILWSLTSLFANHFLEDGMYPKQIVKAKQHIVKMAKKLENIKLHKEFKQRLDHFIKTNITPRHWSQLVSNYWQLQQTDLLKKETKASEVENTEYQSKMYKFEGSNITIKEIKKLLNTSFLHYKKILQKLKDENKGFYESALINDTLKHHISQSTQSTELSDIKDYLIKEDKWLNARSLRELGQRFIYLGDVENGLECLELAYSNTRDWKRWKENQQDFKVIAQYDKQRAKKLLINDCYYTLTKYGGYDVPCLVASAFDVLKDVENLERVYQNYSHHCQELFAPLPKRENYKWLNNYTPGTESFNQLAMHFLVDELDSSEADLGNRLTDAFRELCLAKSEIVLPFFVESLLLSDKRIKGRLLSVLYMVAFEKPNLLIPYSEKIAMLLDSKNFQWKMMTIKLVQTLLKSESISENVKEKLNSAQRHYSPTITYPTFRLLHLNPTNKFLDFYEKNVITTVKKQIESCCEVLSIDKDSVLAKIEHILRKEGWTEENEKERIKNEWNGYVHPQGFPGILIITSFSLKIFSLFNQILDEIIKRSKVTLDQLETLWRILQPADPEYKLSNINPKPKDIPSLVVSDKVAWLSELNTNKNKIFRVPINQDWITIFEKRNLSQDTISGVPYRSGLLLYSWLIKKGILYSFSELEKETPSIIKLQRFNENESISLRQAREILLNPQTINRTQIYSSLPILAWKTNTPLFFGYRDIVSLPNYLITHNGLTYRNFNLYIDSKCVVKYEVWQEGYEDEGYSRELLSYGTRLLIHRDLLLKIMKDFNVEFCQFVFEKRLYFKSKYEKESTEKKTREFYKIVHC